MNIGFLKTKKFYIFAAIALLIIFISYNNYKKSHAVVAYDTVKPMRGDLVQTVEATGKLESKDDLALRFEVPGTVGEVRVKENSQVKAGDWLANLRLSELNAAVAQASANLNQKLAGPSNEDRAYYEAAVVSAKASWEQSKADAISTVATAEAAVQTAKNNLKMAEGGDNSEIVNNAYEDAVSVLQTALSSMENALIQSDNILGVDNSLANSSFKDYLSILDASKLNLAKGLYANTKISVNAAKEKVIILNTFSPHISIDAALPLATDALSQSVRLLSSITDVLNATPPVGTLTQDVLNTKKTTIDTTRTTITTQYTAVINQKQTLADAKTSYDSYLVAYNKAISDLTSAKVNAEQTINVREAAYNQAVATLSGKINTPREVDVAAYRAALAAAVASRDKAIIRAPIDGVITKINKKVGEFVSSVDAMIQMLSPHYEIKVDIPETDIAKMQLGDKAQITLDAFGDDVKFNGTVAQIDPASTEVQDVVYYKVTVTIDDTAEPIKSGMTANVVFSTDKRENVLSIPSRAVRANGSRYVKVLVNAKTGETKDVPLTLGLKADDGKVEIISGLSENDEVILGTK